MLIENDERTIELDIFWSKPQEPSKHRVGRLDSLDLDSHKDYSEASAFAAMEDFTEVEIVGNDDAGSPFRQFDNIQVIEAMGVEVAYVDNVQS